MATGSDLEQQQRIVGPDGITYYIGDGIVRAPFTAVNGEASATMVVSEAAKVGSALDACVIPRTESVAVGSAVPADVPQALVLKVLRLAATTDLAIIGVARSSIPFGKSGAFAGQGSIVCAKCTATTITAGNKLGGSATAGSLASQTGNTTTGLIAGIAVKTNTVALPGTGSTTQVGMLVASGG